jgi:hypothetical protein
MNHLTLAFCGLACLWAANAPVLAQERPMIRPPASDRPHLANGPDCPVLVLKVGPARNTTTSAFWLGT